MLLARAPPGLGTASNGLAVGAARGVAWSLGPPSAEKDADGDRVGEGVSLPEVWGWEDDDEEGQSCYSGRFVSSGNGNGHGKSRCRTCGSRSRAGRTNLDTLEHGERQANQMESVLLSSGILEGDDGGWEQAGRAGCSGAEGGRRVADTVAAGVIAEGLLRGYQAHEVMPGWCDGRG